MSPRPERDETAKARFEELFEQTRIPILSYLLRRVGRRADAADLLAEVYLIAWRRIRDVPNGDEARLWLYAVARRVLANHYRSETRAEQLGNRLRDDLAMRLDSSRVITPLADELTGRLAELAPEDRELIQLSVWEGLSAADIGRITDQSAGAVRVRLHRIRKQLAARMQAAPATRSTPSTRSAPVTPTNREPRTRRVVIAAGGAGRESPSANGA